MYITNHCNKWREKWIMTDKTGIWTQALWISWQVLYSLSYVVPALEPFWPSYSSSPLKWFSPSKIMQHQLGFFPPVSWRRNKWNIRYRRNNNCQYVTNFLQVSTQVEFWPQTTFPLRIWVEDCIEWFENIGDNAKVWISSQVLYRGTDIQTTVWHQDCK